MQSVKVSQFSGSVTGVSDPVGGRVQQMLESGRRYFGSAGASLTHQVKNPDFDSAFSEPHVTVGLNGERDTSKRLQKWMVDKPNVVLVDSAHIVGMGKEKEQKDPETGLVEGGGDTDHILILGNTVIIIDTKRWKSKRKYSISDKGTVLRSGRSFPGGSRLHAKQARFLWQAYLVKPCKVMSLVCINSEKVFVSFDKNWYKQPFRLITVEHLEEMLNKLYDKLPDEDKTTINSDLVSQVVVCCVKPYDEYLRVFDKATLADFQ